MTGFNNDLAPDLLRKEHDDYAIAMNALSSCSSPSACSPVRLTDENAPRVLKLLGYKKRWGLWYHPCVEKSPTWRQWFRVWWKKRHAMKENSKKYLLLL